MPGSKILIVGAGLGGLTLAQSLRSQGIDFEIFERDAGPQARVQGWAVGLHKIIPVLQQIVPPEAPAIESTSVTAGHPGMDTVGWYDSKTGEPMDVGSIWVPGKSIRINRAKFRQYLLTGLPVKWGCHFTHYEIIEGGAVKALFEDGTTAIGDILVGADGLRSRVRNTLYQPNPPLLNTIPVGTVVGEITLNREQYERQAKLGRAFYIARQHGILFFVGLRGYSEDLSEGYFYWFTAFPDNKPEDSWINNATQEELLSFTKNYLKGMHPDFREILDLQKPEGVSQAFILYDRVPEVCPDGPVTLIGDAAHPMTPFRGQGANNAMEDAVGLGQKIGEATKSRTSLSQALRAYEEAMVPRASEMVL
ncbi:hypothetical protein HWV62_3739 [Athelia sp. TMB]|nr:hypothetical protein HWV62_3739 [Athelia sp. TMB]